MFLNSNGNAFISINGFNVLKHASNGNIIYWKLNL